MRIASEHRFTHGPPINRGGFFEGMLVSGLRKPDTTMSGDASARWRQTRWTWGRSLSHSRAAHAARWDEELSWLDALTALGEYQ